MSRLFAFFRRMRMEASSGKRYFRHGDPTLGLEYNKIIKGHFISRRLMQVDIARTPLAIRSTENHVNVHGMVRKANRAVAMISFKEFKCKGSSRS